MLWQQDVAGNCAKKKMATENFIARRSESADAESISSMVARQTENIFGRTDVEMVM